MNNILADVLEASLAVKSCYESYQHKAGTIEFSEFAIDGSPELLGLAFKGTHRNEGTKGTLSLIRDIATDVRFIPRNDLDIGWHPAGFITAVEEVISYLLEEGLIDPQRPIVLAGHSLGGAVVLLLAYVLFKEGFSIRSVITLGAPNVGALPEMPGVLVDCLKNGRDIVPSVPPFYGDPYPVQVITGVPKKRWNFAWFTAHIGDHMLDSYLETLAFMVRREVMGVVTARVAATPTAGPLTVTD